MCRGIGKTQKNEVNTINAGLGFPAYIDEELFFMEFSVSMGIAYGPDNNGFRPIFFDASISAEANFGLIFGTVEMHHFLGTYDQYENATNASFYYGLGAGLLMGSANSEGIVFGAGFGGRWLDKIPFGQNTIQAVKHKGFSVSQDTGAF